MGKPTALRRPMPPAELGRFTEGSAWPESFMPAEEVATWMRSVFLDEEGALYNEEHKHLLDADIAFLWADGGFNRQMRQVVGLCEELTFRCGPWQKGRQELQMCQWFGRVPAYLITLDARYAASCTDTDFCALVEHELYHIGQALDEYGAPKFDRSGYPKLAMRGHDVEEFVGIVKRYGTGAPDSAVARMVEAANKSREASSLRISQACGTCLLRAA